MPSEAWLLFNSGRSIKVNRENMIQSCDYFRCLLGPNDRYQFKEHNQYCVDMNIGDMFTFEAFECVVRYASEGVFLKDPSKHDTFIEAIQLASLWNYDEFVELVEYYLIEQIDSEKFVDMWSVANRHKFTRLLEACLEFDKCFNDRFENQLPARCPHETHKQHHILNCLDRERLESDAVDLNPLPKSLTEEEKLKLADDREMWNIRHRRKLH